MIMVLKYRINGNGKDTKLVFNVRSIKLRSPVYIRHGSSNSGFCLTGLWSGLLLQDRSVPRRYSKEKPLGSRLLLQDRPVPRRYSKEKPLGIQTTTAG